MRSAPAPLALLAAALTLSACDKAKDRHPPPPEGQAAAPAAPAGPPMPAMAEWAKAMVGKPKAELFPGEAKPCKGNTDNLEQRFADGAAIVGWAWDPATKKPVPRVILVDAKGLVAGGGEPGIPRPDVNRVVPEIKAPDTGWRALTVQAKGVVEVYGVVDGGKALCGLGHLDY